MPMKLDIVLTCFLDRFPTPRRPALNPISLAQRLTRCQGTSVDFGTSADDVSTPAGVREFRILPKRRTMSAKDNHCRGPRTMDWADLRRQMLLDPNVINLNTGSFGP